MIGFNWFNEPGVQKVMSFVYSIIDVIRIIVPIVLIVMTTIDITKKIIDPNEKEGQKKIIDPNEKEGQKKIMTRAIAAIIVFFVPTLVNFVFKIMDIDINSLKQGGSSSITPSSTVKPTPVNTVVPTIEPTPVPAPTPTSVPTPSSTPKPTLSDITLYCPSSKEYSKIGDIVEIKTNIPASFNGEISWSEDSGAAKITPINGNRSAKVEILDQPKLMTVWITVVAGGKAKTCHINISALDKIEITNCPSSSKVYHVGDKFILESNLPSFYKGSYAWGSAVDPSIAKITPLDNGRRAQVEIVGVPKDKYIHIAVAADSPVKSFTCKINIE